MKEYNLKQEAYSLGNQSKKYPVNLDYLEFLPKGFDSWYDWHNLLENKYPCVITIVHKESKFETEIFVRQMIIRDAFPSTFFSEDLSNDFHVFAICTNKKELKKEFIIPLW